MKKAELKDMLKELFKKDEIKITVISDRYGNNHIAVCIDDEIVYESEICI